MIISDGNSTKTLNWHPPARPKFEHENAFWIENEDTETNLVKLVLSIEKALPFRDETQDDIINNFFNNVALSSLPTS